MSSASPRTTSCPVAQGLHLDRFLDTLDWASDSHPRVSQSQGSCIACKSQPLPSPDRLPISIDHLTAYAAFSIAPHHRIAFSPPAAGQPPLSRVPAVLSIEDGKLRLSLDASQQRKRCVTINLAKLISGPDVNHTEDTLCLQFVFPFVSLLLERPRRGANLAGEPASTRELQFAAMKEAAAELRDMPSSNDQPIASPEGEKHLDQDMSLFTTSLDKVRESEETNKMSLDKAFTNFMNRGTEMVMPLCFPYNRCTTPASAIGNTRADHAAFVDAYLKQEAVWGRTIQQVDAALYFAKRRRNKNGEKDGKHAGESDEIFRDEALNEALKPS